MPPRFVIVYGLLSAAIVVTTWHTAPAGFLSDDAMYLLMADFFSPYLDSRPPVLAYVMHHARFPPLYPLCIALAGGGSENLAVAHVITGGFFAAALVAFHLLAVREGLTHGLALCLAGLLALLPASLIGIHEIWSEYQYLLLVGLCVWLSRVGLDRGGDFPALAGAALIAGLAALTRSAGLLLVVAFVIGLLTSGARSKLRLTVIAASPPLAWVLLKQVWGVQGNYLESLAGLSGDAQYWFTRGASVWQALVANFATDRSGIWSPALVAAVTLPAAFALVVRVVRQHIDAYYVLLYLTALIVWPFPAHDQRLIYPLIPFLLLYACLGTGQIVQIAGCTRRHASARWVVPLLSAGALAGSATEIAGRYLDDVPAEYADFKMTRYWLQRSDARARVEIPRRQALIRGLRRIRDHVPQTECVMAANTPAVMLHAKRIAVSYPAHRQLEKSLNFFDTCRYYFIINFGNGTDPPMYPIEHVADNARPVAHSSHDGLVVSVLYRRERAR